MNLDERIERISALPRTREADRVEICDPLKQPKKEVGHGRWMKWLKEHRDALGFGWSQAKVYMLSDGAHASYFAKQASRTRKGRALAEKAKRAVKDTRAEAIEQAVLTPIPEPAVQALMNDIIASGYRAMSKKYHPDLGGSNGKQAAVSAMRDTLMTLLGDPFCPWTGGAR